MTVQQPRCEAWMPRAGEPCAKPENHNGAHMTAAGVRRMYDRSIAHHQATREQRYAKINEYKLRRGCIDCGYNDDPVALDFDHRDRESKLFNVAQMLTYAWHRIVAELDKCDIRCANCHRIKTYYSSGARRRPGSRKAEDRA